MRSDHAVRVTAALALAVSLAACGGGDDDAEPVASSDDDAPVTSSVETTAAAAPASTAPLEPTTPPTTPAPTTPPTTAPATTAPATTVPFDPAAGFRDDFDGGLLADAGWMWENEDPENYRFEDGWLVITGDVPNVGTGETRNLLYRAVPEGIDISIVTHLAADLTENFEAVGMALLGDDARIQFHAGYCQHCLPEVDGVGLWIEAYQGDVNLLGYPCCGFAWESDGDEVTLAIEWSPDAGVAIGWYQHPDGERQQMFRLDEAPTFDRFALYAYDGIGPFPNEVNVEGRFDWFELTTYP